MSVRLGHFTSYARIHFQLPATHPFKGQPQGSILWTKNEKGEDWYDLVPILPSSVEFSYVGVDADSRVITVTRDPSMLFPTDYTLYQVPGIFDQEVMGQMFDPATDSFTT